MPEKLSFVDDQELAEVAGGRYLGPTFVYIVQKGDTISLLAQRFGTTVKILQELNNIKNASLIQPGMRLLIPQR